MGDERNATNRDADNAAEGQPAGSLRVVRPTGRGMARTNDAELLWHPDTFELISAYRRIGSATIRRHLFELIEAAARSSEAEK